MKKYTLLTLLILSSYFVTFSQNKIFLEKKGFYKDKKTGTLKIIPSISEDNSILTITGFLTETESARIKMSFSGILLNLKTGRTEHIFNGVQSYFINNELLINDMTKISGKWLGFGKLTNIFSQTSYYILNPKTLEKTYLNFPKGELFTSSEHGYVTTTNLSTEKSSVYVKQGNSFLKQAQYDIFMAKITSEGDAVYGFSQKNNEIKIFDIKTGTLKNLIKLNKTPTQVYLTKNNILVYNEFSYNSGNVSSITYIKDLNNNQIISVLQTGAIGNTIFRVNENRDEIITVNQKTGIIKLWSVSSGKLIKEVIGTFVKQGSKKTKDANVYPLDSEGKFFIITYSNGIMNLFSSEERKIVADMFIDGKDWAVIARDGRVDGTAEAFKKLEWQEYDKNNKLVKTTSLDAVFNNFFTPGVLYSILNEKSVSENLLVKQLNNTPTIKISSPENNTKTSKKEISIKLTAEYYDDPIKEILVYLNGKLISPEETDYERTETEYSKTYNINLLPGENTISCKAVTFNDYESETDEITVNYSKKVKKTTDLYLLVIGINNYKNPKYKLNYALADALAFKKEIEAGSNTIFKNVFVTHLTDTQASRNGIIEAFNNIKDQAFPSDVFIFYYAGHGVMSEEQKSEFFIVPYDVTQLYGNNEILRSKGISAEELREFSKNLEAQKQLFVFDACQSGGIIEHLASRGVAEERAIAQLARSTGTFWLTASNSEQYAAEFEELGHGLFTYTILKGLEGDADGSSKDKKITVKEISAYLNDMVPQLSQKYKGTFQFPNSYGYGQDFPVKIVK